MADTQLVLLRKRIADKVGEALQAFAESGVQAQESPSPPELMHRDPRYIRHLAYAVALRDLDTTLDPKRSHRRGVGAMYAEQLVRIRFLWNLRVDAVVSDTDAATNAEPEVLDKLSEVDLAGTRCSGLVLSRIYRGVIAAEDGGTAAAASVMIDLRTRITLATRDD